MSAHTSSLPFPVAPIWIKLRNGALRRIRSSDIEWIEADGNYIRLHLAGETLTSRGTIVSMEAQLGSALVRIHRRMLVNRDLLRELRYENGLMKVVLSTGAEFETSRSYKAGLLASMGRGGTSAGR
jgi:two-component system LytT family response regulator